MPSVNDHWEEMDHLRKMCLRQQEQLGAQADMIASARQEMEDSRREARNLRAEVQRLQVELSDERHARRTAERSLRNANDALAVHRKAVQVGEEIAAAVNANNRNGGRH